MKNHLHNKNIAGYEHQDVQSERKQETTAFEYQRVPVGILKSQEWKQLSNRKYNARINQTALI